ncbi:MAG: MotA/TolQ/ExbB proton channel family protein [Planctomycetales bacterium]|nr:MotA/TolQ/ExbB proton channel family protein [Planctomycetales bacterium]
MSRVTSFSEWLLRQGLIWGGLAALAFYALVVRGADDGSFLQRYFAGHTIAYCATALFFVGVAELVIKWLGLLLQFATLDGVQLPTAAAGEQEAEEAKGLLASLNNISASLQESYLVRRLREALLYVQSNSSADKLEPHLRHLEEVDQSRMHQSYGLVRIIVSTIPILGFLGTVIGITLAIAKLNLSGEAMDESLPAVVSGLSVAFDTTALALSLSTVLLFVKYCVERVELRLLTAVDANASRQLIGRFRQYGSENDPYLASIHRMSEKLLKTVESSLVRQAATLRLAFEQGSQQWSEVLANTASTLDEALSSAVVEGLTRHAEALNEGVDRHAADLEQTLIKHAELLNEGLVHHTSALTEAESLLAEENRRHLGDVEAAVGEAMLVATNRQEKLIKQSEDLLKEMQIALVEAAGTTVAQQEQLIKQGDMLLKIVEATGQIKQLEDSLNKNLNALAGSHSFQQTAAGLAAAVQLLGARLGVPFGVAGEVELVNESKNQAA